ncbi:hypothetical protein LSAT2_022589 [Lamellibrachia satsuma]|nr:hypothetical protein LSAT2_022589 [Lamellibrachia satsuma]
MGMGIGGVGLLSTIIAAPVILGLEAAALACGLFGFPDKFVSCRLAVNTIADHVSTTLIDDDISDHEFRLIQDEVEKYHQIQTAAHAAVVL